MVGKFILILFFSLLSFVSKAEPKNIRVLFLSRSDAAAFIDNAIYKSLYPSFSVPIVQNEDSSSFECIPYGEGCFHPQLGYIEDEEKAKEMKKDLEKKKAEEDLKTINSEEVNLINCDKEYYFDMYCGKAKKPNQNAPVLSQNQLWVDISSSLKGVDFSKDEGYCERRRIVAKLEEHCGSKLDIFTFNTSRQRMGSLEDTCLNYGTNNGEKLVHWLEESEATNVVIITDVDEYVGPFREYLDKVGATIEGIGVKPLQATELFGFFDDLKSVCK